MPGPRVVSLLPSATEVLCAIGGETLLVGRSHECDVPALIADRPVLTAQRTAAGDSALAIDDAVRASLAAGESLYTVDDAALRALRPDVILTQDLCAVCSIDLAAVRRIAADMQRADGQSVEVVSLNPHTVEDVLDTLLTVGDATGLTIQATAAVVALRERLFSAQEFVNPFAEQGSVALLEWTDPMFCAGHWTVQLIERAGAVHPLNATVARPGSGAAAGPQRGEQVAGPSRRISREELLEADPQWLIVCPCGIGLEKAEASARALLAQPWTKMLPAVRNNRVAVVDGNLHFNRPGPRLVEAFEWLVGWLNNRPEMIPVGFEWKPLRG